MKVGFGRSSVRKYRIFLTVGILFLFSIGIFIPENPTNQGRASAATTSTSHSIGLSLTARPSVLPADGGVYSALVLEFKNLSSGMPYVPQSPVNISMTSSTPQTGAVPSAVVFPANNLFTLVDFSTTTLPGSTVISAITAGYAPATLNMSTKTVGGSPNALQIFLSPSQIPPDEKTNSSVIVQAVDAFGNPVDLGEPLTVSLSSSNAQVGSVPPTVTIPAGQSFGTATFFPTYIAGQTVITAAAANYVAGSAVMTTIGPVARRLVLSMAPSELVATPGRTSTLSIQLQDNNSQTPAIAPTAVSVVLTSSNTAVVDVPSTIITIPAGSSYTSVAVTSGGAEGGATITASAQGYVKGSVGVNASFPSSSPIGLAEYFAPGTLLPNNMTYQGVLVVQLQAAGGIPATAISPVTVYARSSNNATMQVSTTPATIEAGQSQVSIDVSSTFLPGTAQITAQSPGYTSATQSLLSFGPAPNALSLQFAPSTILADGQTYNSITVGLIDSQTGIPAKAPVNVIVDLASSSASVGQIQATVTIPIGQTYARANFATSDVAGSTFITASASNYTSTNGTLGLVTKAATHLGLYASPSILLANNQTYQNVIVQLQDSNGNPEKTDSPVSVQLAVQDVTAGVVGQSVTIPAGSTFAPLLLNTTTKTGSINITAFANGFQSSSIDVQSALIPMSAHVSLSDYSVLKNGKSNVTLQALADNLPVANASLKWSVISGSLIDVVNSTNSSGYASALYSAGSALGSYTIRVTITKSGYTTYVASTTVNVVSSLTGTSQKSGGTGLNMSIGFLPLWSIIVIAVAAPSAAFFVVKRRSAAGAGGYEIEAEE